MEELSFWVGIVASAAFAITGVLAISERGVDLFGVLVLGIITAIGGGTIRDVIMGVPVFWADAPIYILVAAIASIITFYSESILSQPQLYKAILYIDGLGAALFGIQGADKAWHEDFGGSEAAIILGVVTAIGGGLIRDVLAGRKTLLMSYELYAIPVSLGCMLYVLLLKYFPEYAMPGSIACILLIFFFRSAAIYWNLTVPAMFISRKK